ncbi:MAG: hypothetical protein N2690_03705 [Rhodocyclaceae bacterium]|nr:hypothetical protein [Rhodocyclaceae bacterium]
MSAPKALPQPLRGAALADGGIRLAAKEQRQSLAQQVGMLRFKPGKARAVLGACGVR